jgi:hypothetical protein
MVLPQTSDGEAASNVRSRGIVHNAGVLRVPLRMTTKNKQQQKQTAATAKTGNDYFGRMFNVRQGLIFISPSAPTLHTRQRYRPWLLANCAVTRVCSLGLWSGAR